MACGYGSAVRIAVAALAALVLAGTAAAGTIRGSARAELLVGTARADIVRAGGGDDRISVEADARRDRVECGPGRDLVALDRLDVAAADCETITRQISRDRTTDPEAQHRTQVEPDSFAAGRTIVTTFQVGRFFDGGAEAIGFSTSIDAGVTWRDGLLPSLTIAGSPGGPSARASDPVVARDEAHAIWLVASLALGPGGTSRLAISRSGDGIAWTAPVDAASSTTGSLGYDKEWLVCDNGTVSPFRGRCYLAYTDLIRSALSIQSSSDGGVTWSPAVSLPFFPLVGAYPATLPDGTLVVLYNREQGGIEAVRSLDGGATFAGPVTVGSTLGARPRGLRMVPIPTVDVDDSGRLLTVWPACVTRQICNGNDIVLSTSQDGATWSAPRRVSRGADAFIPAIAAAPGGSLAVAYYARRTEGVDAWLIRSADGGVTWGRAQRLSPQTMALRTIADTNQGRMLADYVSISWADGRPVTVLSLASPPSNGAFEQSIVAATAR